MDLFQLNYFRAPERPGERLPKPSFLAWDWNVGRFVSALSTGGVLVLLLAATTSCGLAADNLQALLNAAKPGDTIVLPAGELYTGNFTLPKKSGDATITITSSEASSISGRVTPADRRYLARIRSTNTAPALTTSAGAHNYKLVGLEIYVEGNYSYGVVNLGSAEEKTVADLPRDIEMDRLYVHGDAVLGSKRGVTLNGASMTIRNSYISDFKSKDQDSQAICGWNGPGPFEIANNYLEAAGENIMFGGAIPSIRNMVPSDIEIRGNYLFKPLSWKKDHPSFGGTVWPVKNLFELKNARRVHVAGNILENCWSSAQDGYALQLTVRTEEGGANWAVVEDVVFEDNWVRNVEHGVNLLGVDSTGGITRRITIRNNLWTGVRNRLSQALYGVQDLTIEHNTAFNSGSPVFLETSASKPIERFVFRNNICGYGNYGVFGSDTAGGTTTLARYAPGAVFSKNVIVAPKGTTNHPPEPVNFYPTSLDYVVFRNAAASDYHLAQKSPYRNAASDGAAIGADIDRVVAATANAIKGR